MRRVLMLLALALVVPGSAGAKEGVLTPVPCPAGCVTEPLAGQACPQDARSLAVDRRRTRRAGRSGRVLYSVFTFSPASGRLRVRFVPRVGLGLAVATRTFR